MIVLVNCPGMYLQIYPRHGAGGIVDQHNLQPVFQLSELDVLRKQVNPVLSFLDWLPGLPSGCSGCNGQNETDYHKTGKNPGCFPACAHVVLDILLSPKDYYQIILSGGW